MTARAEIEEMLDAKLWADRNDVELNFGSATYLPALELLRENELRTYRDCPLEYETQPRDFWRDGWVVFWLLVLAAISAAVVWNWPHHH